MEDIFGKYLWDYYHGKNCFEITERDDGFISYTPIERYFRGYCEWPKSEQFGVRFVKGEVLDIGCGAGRHSLFLQRNNLKVLGIDLSEKALEISSDRGVKRTAKIDLGRIHDLNSSFDTAILLGNNFGLLKNPNNAIEFLNNLHDIIKEGGLLVVNSRNPYKTDNEIHLNYLEKNRKKGRFPGQLKLRLRYRDEISDWFDFMLASPNEMKQIFYKTDWDLLKMIEKENKDYVGLFKK